MHLDSATHRGLTVVDDYKLREDLFSTSALLLKKIHKLEKVHADFLNFDQLLYQDWYNVTFRKELQTAEQLERRLKSLSTFQVHLLQIAKTSQVSLEQAYAMLKQEEAQYQEGDEAWQFVIEKLRQQRYEHATKPTKAPQPAEASPEKPAEPALLQEDDSALSGLRRHDRSVYHYLTEIDDNMLARHLSDDSAGFQLFKEAFQIAMKCGDWKLLARLWKTAGSIFQEKLLKPMPAHLKDFLLQMFVENEKANKVMVDPEAELLLRSSYRKLARLLHPDSPDAALFSDSCPEWAAKKWQKVQTAYAAQDHGSLKNLELICLAELGQLNQLTLTEIYQSSLILAEELETLKKNLKIYRKHRAWNFSSRRKYGTLAEKVRQEIQARIAPIEAQVKSIEEFLEGLSQSTKTTRP